MAGDRDLATRVLNALTATPSNAPGFVVASSSSLPAVHRPHLVIGPIALLAILGGSLALISDPGSFEASAAGMISFGLIVVGVTGLAGLLLARAPWGRWLLAATVTAAMLLASVGSGWLSWTTYALGGLALVGLLGPWLTLWTRHHRAIEAPGTVVIILESTAVAAPLFVGLASARSGVTWYQWTLVVLVMTTSILYGRGRLVGRWAFRIVVPLAAIVVGATMADLGGVAVALAGVLIGGLAWSRAATRTTTVVAPVLPTPIPRGSRR